MRVNLARPPLPPPRPPRAPYCDDDPAECCCLIRSGEGYHFPLFHASDGDSNTSRVDEVTLLLKAKAGVNFSTPGGCTALWKACNEGHTDVVNALIHHKADVNQLQAETTISPLCVARH